jgi:hypothetical protein
MRKTSLAALLSFISLVLNAQTFDLGDYAVKAAYAQFKAKQVVPPSPDAANLGKFGNVPISLFTGTPQVSIPLIELSSKFPLNISLTYNNNGFKPGEPASWVGLGWTLNAGGVITRSALGNPDLPENYFNKPPIVLPPNSDLFARYDIINDMRRGELETMPDIYYYNVGKLSGKFNILQDVNKTVSKKTRDNVQITHCITCLPSLSWFRIVDEQGFIYEFRDVEISNTITDTQVPQDLIPVRTSYAYPSAWYLTKITSPDYSETMEFEYFTTGQHTTLTNNIQGQSISYSRSIVLSSGPGCPASGGAVTNSISYSDIAMNKVSRKYLKRISLKRSDNTVAYVDFISEADTRLDLEDADYPGERRLTKLQLFQRDGFGNSFRLKQEQELFHSYFTDAAFSATPGGKRLRLDGVRENAILAGTSSKPPYQFAYRDFQINVTHPMALDHWGYTNGIVNTSLVPNIQVGADLYGLGANREPSSVAAESGLLQSITYPTGGSTQFVWEANDAFTDQNNLVTVGGLRIRTITDFSSVNQKASVKRYRYVKTDQSSSGRTATVNYFSSGTFYKYPENCWGDNSKCCGFWTESRSDNWTIAATPVLALGSMQGSQIGYTRVIEESLDISGLNPLGSTIYEYNILRIDPNDDDISNGELLRTTVFNNGGKMLSEVTNQYQFNTLGTVVYRTPQVEEQQDSKNILCKYLSNGQTVYEWRTITSTNPQPCIESRSIKTKYNFGGYVVANQEKFMVRQTQRLYDQSSNSFITSVRNFSYGTRHMLPTRIEQSTTGSEVVVNEIKYPLDYSYSLTSDPPSIGIKSMIDANLVTAEIENIQYRQNSDGSNRRFINASLTMYDNRIQPTRLLRLENNTAVSSIVSSSISGAGAFTYDPNIKPYAAFAYDNLGNLIQQQKDKDAPTSYVWDHFGMLPTAEVKNASADMIAYSSFESDGTGGFSTLPNLMLSRVNGGFTGGYAYNLTGNSITKTNLPSGRNYVISYWSKNGPATVTAGGGVIAPKSAIYPSHLGWTYYEHLVTNPGNLSVSGSSTIDELRIYPSDAAMSSIAYTSFDARPSSVTDASNNRSNFEYDGHNRLLNVRDDDNSIVKNFSYQYGTANTITAPVKTLFYNSPAQAPFSRQGCILPAEPLPIAYVVPYGKYAAISQSAADAQVNTDMQQNGQAFANANGRCVVYNQDQSGVFYKNNCAPDKGTSTCPLGVTYTVQARTYYANTLSEANDLAINDLKTNGQNYANTTCGCNCDGINKKVINGVCETGYMVYTGYQYVPNCQTGWNYRCFYYYQFSDGTVTPTYSSCSRFPCVPQ